MLLSDLRPVSRLAFALVLSVAVVGCQVRPLYSDAAPNAAGVVASAALSSIAIDEVQTRYAQEVRNQLIFALSGGAGETASPVYNLSLGVSNQVISSASLQAGEPDVTEPSAGAVILTSLYTLKEASTGKVIASGKRRATASFDRPNQQFATLRAQRDAENRAARELAEMLKLALAADLSR